MPPPIPIAVVTNPSPRTHGGEVHKQIIIYAKRRNMKYAEMLNSPFTIFDTPSGIVACSRDIDQLPTVLQAIGGRGLLLGRPKTYNRIAEINPGLFSRDDEGGPAAILWRSIMPPRRRYERAKSQQSRPVLWSEVPGSVLLWNLLSEDEIRLLKFTLNCQQWFTNPEIKSDGFAAYSAALVSYLGDSL